MAKSEKPDPAPEPDGGAKQAGGGEPGGGAYPNPNTGKEPTASGFMSHGGQTDIAYHGGQQLGDDDQGGNANSAAGPDKQTD